MRKSDLQEELHRPILAAASSSEPPPNHDEEGSELEKVLTDTRIPMLKKMRRASWMEFKRLLYLAAPAIFVYTINNGMSLSTRVFAGHLGNTDLAAASLGNGGIQVFSYGLMVC